MSSPAVCTGFRSLRSKSKVAFIALTFSLVLARGAAQTLQPASPPLANPEDSARFASVHEDFSTPLLKEGSLHPIQPLIASVADQPDYIVQLIDVQWRAADPIDLYVIRPRGVAKPPVILYLYGYPVDTDRFQDRDFQKMATKGGFAAVAFVSALTGHRYHDRPMSQWFLSELPEALTTSAHDVQMVLNYLATRNDLDLSRVGLFGQGSGGSIGILASAADPRIKVLDVLDPWADWPDWFPLSTFVPEDERPLYMKPGYQASVAPLDPVVWLPKIQSHKFRLEDAVFIRSTPKVCKDKLKAAMPATGSMVSYSTETDFQPMAEGGKILDWIKAQLTGLSIDAPQNDAADKIKKEQGR